MADQSIPQEKVCSVCGLSKPLSAFHKRPRYRYGVVAACVECTKARTATYRERNRDAIRASGRAYYQANKERAYQKAKKWRTENIEKWRESAKIKERRVRRRLREEVLAAYGEKCACCGEGVPQFLSVDHIYNDGAAHRRELSGNKSSSSYVLYKWLKRNGFPKDRFQLLCFNCNHAKGTYGFCPHKRQE